LNQVQIPHRLLTEKANRMKVRGAKPTAREFVKLKAAGLPKLEMKKTYPNVNTYCFKKEIEEPSGFLLFLGTKN
jgi:hypothetical protein